MIDNLLNQISKQFALKERDIKDYKNVNVKPMKFQVRSFKAEGLGTVLLCLEKLFLAL